MQQAAPLPWLVRAYMGVRLRACICHDNCAQQHIYHCTFTTWSHAIAGSLSYVVMKPDGRIAWSRSWSSRMDCDLAEKLGVSGHHILPRARSK